MLVRLDNYKQCFIVILTNAITLIAVYTIINSDKLFNDVARTYLKLKQIKFKQRNL